MLLLLFQLQDEAYAIDSARVVEVVPYLLTQNIPMSPKYIVGMINYRGNPVPVIDLGLLLNDTPCRQQLSTRIILTTVSFGNRHQKMVGLLAENVTETVKPPADWRLKQEGSGTVILDRLGGEHPMIRWFDADTVLPHDIPGLSFVES